MKIGDLVQMKCCAFNEIYEVIEEIGVITDFRPAERNGQRLVYCRVLLGDNSTHWLSPEEFEVL